jgi:hypothetical protein
MLLFAAPAHAEDVEPPSPAPFVVLAAGGIAILGGGLFALMSSGASSGAMDATSHADAVAANGNAQTFAHVANALLVTGAALALLGAGWMTVELTRAERQGGAATAHLDLGPTSLTLRGTF